LGRYQKGKTNLDFTEARDSEWQWHQLGHKKVCTSLQADNQASTPPLSFLQAGCPSCRSTNSVKALKATQATFTSKYMTTITESDGGLFTQQWSDYNLAEVTIHRLSVYSSHWNLLSWIRIQQHLGE